GDTSASVTGLIISITCLGTAPKDDIVYRNGAHDTDLICVSGDLGAAYMGLQLLEREREASEGIKDFQPDFAGREYLIERQLKPEARRDVIDELRQLGVRPEEAVYIGDTEIDIETAANAKLRCVAVTWGFRSEAFLEKCGAETIVSAARELLPALTGG
ncbi:MAG: HAD hydrolase-like protein, partial [Clostridia bacterium]|nr:HAD hydrolase-like protein [Clostridia bacterium]